MVRKQRQLASSKENSDSTISLNKKQNIGSNLQTLTTIGSGS